MASGLRNIYKRRTGREREEVPDRD